MHRQYVFDNSVIMAAFLPDRQWHREALGALSLVLAGDVLAIAPGNAFFEFCGAMANTLRTRRKPVEEALRALTHFMRLPIRFVEDRRIVQEAVRLSFRYQKNCYDMLYFAAARSEGITVCTADEKAITGLPREFPCQYVHLRDFRNQATPAP